MSEIKFNEDYRKCYFCGDDCNIHSQSCGVCSRQMTFYNPKHRTSSGTKEKSIFSKSEFKPLIENTKARPEKIEY